MTTSPSSFFSNTLKEQMKDKKRFYPSKVVPWPIFSIVAQFFQKRKKIMTFYRREPKNFAIFWDICDCNNEILTTLVKEIWYCSTPWMHGRESTTMGGWGSTNECSMWAWGGLIFNPWFFGFVLCFLLFPLIFASIFWWHLITGFDYYSLVFIPWQTHIYAFSRKVYEPE